MFIYWKFKYDHWLNEILLPNDTTFYIKRNFEPFRNVKLATIVLVSEPKLLDVNESEFNNTELDYRDMLISAKTSVVHNFLKEEKSESVVINDQYLTLQDIKFFEQFEIDEFKLRKTNFDKKLMREFIKLKIENLILTYVKFENIPKEYFENLRSRIIVCSL